MFITGLFFSVDGLPCWIYRRAHYKSPPYWPFLMKWESKKGRADLHRSSGANDKKRFGSERPLRYLSDKDITLKHWYKAADAKGSCELWPWTEYILLPSIYKIAVIDKRSAACFHCGLSGQINADTYKSQSSAVLCTQRQVSAVCLNACIFPTK